jgi:hypothetical protein
VDTFTKRPVAALLLGVVLAALLGLTLQAPAGAHQPARAGTDGFFAGKLLDRATAKPIKGATVRVFRINTDTLLGHAVSGAEGRFRIDGLSADDEELDVRVNGSAVKYESGWVGCAHTIVRSWGAACSFGQGRQTPFRVRHL